jgi:tetratricopeptide (TPR) repeat protein
MPEPRKLRVFLCHASQDKPIVRELYQRLLAEGWIDPWLDEEKLLLGQDWDMEIEKAVEDTNAVIVFLSNNSVTKEGYVQKELRAVLDVAEYKPEGAIFIIPLRLEECVVPRRLKNYQYQDYFPLDQMEKGYKRLHRSLRARADACGVNVSGILAGLRREAEEKAKRIQELRIRKDAEEKIRREEEELLRKKAEERARKALERKLRKQAQEKARQEREECIMREEEEKSLKAREERVRKEAEEIAKLEEINRRRAEELYRKTSKAVQFESAGDLNSALSVYREIREIDPEYPNVEIRISQLEEKIRILQEEQQRKQNGEEIVRKAMMEASERTEPKEFPQSDIQGFIPNSSEHKNGKLREDLEQLGIKKDRVENLLGEASYYESIMDWQSAVERYYEIEGIYPGFPGIYQKIDVLEKAQAAAPKKAPDMYPTSEENTTNQEQRRNRVVSESPKVRPPQELEIGHLLNEIITLVFPISLFAYIPGAILAFSLSELFNSTYGEQIRFGTATAAILIPIVGAILSTKTLLWLKSSSHKITKGGRIGTILGLISGLVSFGPWFTYFHYVDKDTFQYPLLVYVTMVMICMFSGWAIGKANNRTEMN